MLISFRRAKCTVYPCECFEMVGGTPHDEHRRLFTQLWGRGILRSPFAGSCIESPSTAVRRPSKRHYSAQPTTTIAVLDRYTEIRMNPATNESASAVLCTTLSMPAHVHT